MDTNTQQSNSEGHFSKLPSYATQASHIRYEIAQSLADMAPLSFGQERVLTGSASRGIADEFSDIEMMFYVDALPSYAEREQWLQFVGARDIMLDHEKLGEQEVWAIFYVHDTWVEAGWRVIAAHEQDLANIV